MEPGEITGRTASYLSSMLRTLEDCSLVKLHRSSDTRAARPAAVATEFLVVLDLLNTEA